MCSRLLMLLKNLELPDPNSDSAQSDRELKHMIMGVLSALARCKAAKLSIATHGGRLLKPAAVAACC